jgi:transglutaminase-like putative cysteine protease
MESPKSGLVKSAHPPPVKLRIQHRTLYQYADAVSFGRHQLMLRPRESERLHLEKTKIEIAPTARLRWIRDQWENNVGFIDFSEPATDLSINCEFIVNTSDENPFNFLLDSEAAEYPFSYDYDLFQELRPLIQPIYGRDEDRLREWLTHFWRPGKRIDTLDLLQQLNRDIYRTFRYRRREEQGVQSPAETIENNSGSCRDFATLFIEAARTLGFAARFVSGYAYNSENTGALSMHAWVEIFLPGAGWVGFDPSLGVLVDGNFVPVAVSRHPENAMPVSGTYIGASRVFLRHDVTLYVEPVGDYVPESEKPAAEPVPSQV